MLSQEVWDASFIRLAMLCHEGAKELAANSILWKAQTHRQCVLQPARPYPFKGKVTIYRLRTIGATTVTKSVTPTFHIAVNQLAECYQWALRCSVGMFCERGFRRQRHCTMHYWGGNIFGRSPIGQNATIFTSPNRMGMIYIQSIKMAHLNYSWV